MKALSFGDGLLVTVVSMILSTLVPVAIADVGGGKGYPATPWRKEAPKDVSDLEKAKSVAAAYQTLSVPIEEVNGETDTKRIYFDRVALIPLPFGEGDIALNEFVGKSGSGKAVAISFSQIESFTVLSKSERAITMSVAVWPDISPEELLQKQPTYKQLYDGYRRNVVIKLSLKSVDGRVQALSGDWIERPFPLGELSVGAKCGFYDEHPHSVHPLRFWWAIPSVAEDEEYPFRLIPLL